MSVPDFVDEGTPMAELLHQAASRGLMPNYVGRLLTAFGDGIPSTAKLRPHPPETQPHVEPLSEREIQVLRLLADRPGQVFSRLEIMEELWQSEFSGDVRACDVHISNLRQKVERDPQNPELVLTVRGVGYKFDAAA